jgi:hypothetical protein
MGVGGLSAIHLWGDTLMAADVTIPLEVSPWMSPEPAVLFYFYRPHPGGQRDQPDRELGDWYYWAVPPEVGQHITWLNRYGTADGR